MLCPQYRSNTKRRIVTSSLIGFLILSILSSSFIMIKMSGNVLISPMLRSDDAFAQPKDCTSPPSDMISWWTGDGDAKDLFRRNFGFAEGNPTFGDAIIEQGFNLDGIDDRIRIPSSTDLNPSSQITIEAWIKPLFPNPDDPVGEWSIVSKFNHFSPEGGDDDSYYLGLNSIRSIRWQVDTGISTVVDNILDVPLPDVIAGTFHHIAATYDGVTMKVYLDGSLVGEKAATGPIHNTQTDMFIGATLSSGTLARTFGGAIDEVGIYRRPLLQEEIKSIFDAGSAGKCKDIFFVDSPEVTIRTDKPSYTFGEDIVVSGEVSRVIPDMTVSLFLTAAGGEIIPLADVVPVEAISDNDSPQEFDGRYSHTFHTFGFLEPMLLGTTILTASYSNATSVTEVHIEVPKVIGANISLTTDKETYNVNDTVIVSGNISPPSNVTIGLASPNDADFLHREVRPTESGRFSLSHKLGSNADSGTWMVMVSPDNALDFKQITFEVTGPPRTLEPKINEPPWNDYLQGVAEIENVGNRNLISLTNTGQLDIPLIDIKVTKGSIQNISAVGWKLQTIDNQHIVMSSDNVISPGETLEIDLVWKERPAEFIADRQVVTQAPPPLDKPIGLSLSPPEVIQFVDPAWRENMPSQNEDLPENVNMVKNSNNALIPPCPLEIPITAFNFRYAMEACNKNSAQPQFGEGFHPEWIPVTKDCHEPTNSEDCGRQQKNTILHPVILEGTVVEGKLPKVIIHKDITGSTPPIDPGGPIPSYHVNITGPGQLYVGEVGNFTVNVNGGNSPYSVSLNFNDGTPIAEYVEDMTDTDTEHVTPHSFIGPGRYIVSAKVTDAAGATTGTQIVVLIHGTIEVAEPPHISVVDGTWNHYTHDFAFQVKPFQNYENVLGWNAVDWPVREHRRSTIEVEWETGLTAGNQFFSPFQNPADPNSTLTLAGYYGNICEPYNDVGKSCGFFTSGHDSSGIAAEDPPRREPDTIWNWPTVGDIVHAEGFWVWDRGHSGDKTEIHPPRLIAIQRNLPANIAYWVDNNEIHSPDFEDSFPLYQNGSAYCPSNYLPGPFDARVCGYGLHAAAKNQPLLATRADVFASGDGGALWNNREPPDYEIKTIQNPFSVTKERKEIGTCAEVENILCYGIQRVPMSEKDYTFILSHDIPPPSDNAKLQVIIATHKGDTFRFEPIITRSDEHDQATLEQEKGWPPHVHVTIPWKTMQELDTAVFARTIYLYWEEQDDANNNVESWGASDEYVKDLRIYTVSMDRFIINDNMDSEQPCWAAATGVFATVTAALVGVGLTVAGGALLLASVAAFSQLGLVAVPAALLGTAAGGGVAAAGVAIDFFGVPALGIGTYYGMGACEPDGEYRAFYEVGGKWYFVNEWLLVSDQVTTNSDEGILRDGLGDTGERLGDNDLDEPEGCPTPHGDPCLPFTIVKPGTGSKEFVIYLPKGKDFKIHANGWEADGVDIHFGKIVDPHPSRNNLQQLSNWYNDNLMNVDTFVHGVDDDPAGSIDIRWKYSNFTDLNNSGILEGEITDFDYLGNPWVPCSLLIEKIRQENPDFNPLFLNKYVGCDHTLNNPNLAFHEDGSQWCHTALNRQEWEKKLEDGAKISERRPYSDDPSCVINARKQYSSSFIPSFENGQLTIERWPYYQPFPLVLHSEGEYDLGQLKDHSDVVVFFILPTDPNNAFTVLYSMSEI